MAQDIQVIEDGVDSAPQRESSRPSWILGVVGFALGLGLGVVVVNPTAEEPEEASPPTTAAVATETTAVAEEAAAGVAGAVEGFPDAIVAIARTTSTALDHVLWPLEGEVRVRSMTGGGDVVLSTGSHFIAMSDGVPGLDGTLLSMGRFNSIQPVASGVIGYAWHDSEGSLLGYTRIAGDATGLFSVKADLRSREVTTLQVPGAVVAGFGDWGWAVQRAPEEIVLLTAEGDFKDSEPGRAFATHESGWVFAIEGEQAKLVSAGGGVRRVSPSLGVGGVVDATFSPDGARVAVAGSRGLAVLDVESNEVTPVTGFATTTAAWSSDSRFVLAPSPSGVVIFDLETDSSYPVLREHSVMAVGVVPLRSS